MIKNGNQHIAMLRDGREVYLDGTRVTDVTAHPAFRNSIRSYANLYDFQARPENVDKMTFQPAGGDRRVSRIWELPTSYNELVGRREMLEAWTALHYGFMGRSPDHVASCISGMYMGIEVFEQADPARAGALRDYYRYARDNDLFLTYVIVNPQANQAKAAHEQFLKVLDQDPKNSVALASIASLYFNQKKLEEAKSWYEKLIAVDPNNKEAYYTLGVISWTKTFQPRMEARAKLGMKPEDPGPIKDKKVKEDLKATWLQTINDGISHLEQALQIDPEYDEAMAYMNLLIRERADLADSPEGYKKDIEVADNWVQKALDTKKVKAERAASNAAKGIHTE